MAVPLVPAASTDRPFIMRHAVGIAWVILLTSFLGFCTVCSLGTFGAYYFLFQSETGLSVRLVSARGGVDVTYPDGNTGRVTTLTVEPETTLQTDDTSQGYLIFEDPYSRQEVARVHLLPNTVTTFSEGVRPRFDFSQNIYRVQFRATAGHLFVELPDNVTRQTTVTLETGYGGYGDVVFDTHGQYRANILDQETQLTAYRGSAMLRPRSGQTVLRALPGERATLQRENGILGVRPYPYQTLNIGFGTRDDVQAKPSLPQGWACSNEVDKAEEIQGSWTRALIDNTLVLHMVRQGIGLGHAESSCRYDFGEAYKMPLDIAGYSTLHIQARFKILNQDVTTCGNVGTECPIMLELAYASAGDPQKVWRHGFYAIRTAVETRPLICDTCLQEHEKIALDSWYLYDSGNLLRIFDADKRPVRLQYVRVYASGHAYEVAIADLSVVVGRGDDVS